MVAVVVEHPEVRTERLLRKAREGDHQAFGELVRQHESMVFSIALHAMREASLAEELAQDVFLRLHRKLKLIESGTHLTFWLRRATADRCLDQLKRMRHLGIPVDDTPDLLVLADEDDQLIHKRLRDLVAALPVRQRLALILRYQEELEPGEIASILKISAARATAHLRRALAALRLRLGMASSGDGEVPGAEAER